jgi:hypothetical protein
LDPTAVPPSIRSLLALAERWGIPDDGYRYDAVHGASRDELVELVTAVAEAPEELWTWLVGPETTGPGALSKEYVALTDLTRAADLARVLLNRSPTT